MKRSKHEAVVEMKQLVGSCVEHIDDVDFDTTTFTTRFLMKRDVTLAAAFVAVLTAGTFLKESGQFLMPSSEAVHADFKFAKRLLKRVGKGRQVLTKKDLFFL